MTGCDVLVIGAGPAGCAAAIAAAKAGLATRLLHRPTRPRIWLGESLPPGMPSFIRGVFGEEVLSEPAHREAMGTRSVWGSPDLVETDVIANPSGEAWILDRPRFEADARMAARTAGAGLIKAGRIRTLGREGASWRLETDDGAAHSAGFLIDATGRSRALLRRLGVGQQLADRQIALVATCCDDGDSYSGTTVEAVSEGWWYTTPLPNGLRVIAYLTDEDIWRGGARDWRALLHETLHMKHCAGGNALAATPAAYPAEATISECLHGDGWLAAGDAAACFDPLSSQGIATAVIMATRASDALAAPSRSVALGLWSDAYRLVKAEHDDLRIHYARSETRWPHSTFWNRRRIPQR